MRQPVLVWEVTSGSGVWRRFRTFDEAERFARRLVADSANDRFATFADIRGPGDHLASVRLDGIGRVWTDIKRYPA
jgi:hypothetical protein